jgi:heterodisulfide reductase subunit B
MTVTTPDLPRVKGGVLLFRSCLISTEYPGAEAATKWLFERFGIEYTVHPDQTCCTGLGYYSEIVPVATSVTMAARNASVAVESGHPIMSYLCSTCYAINKKARNILEVPEYRRATNEVLAKIGREYTDSIASAVQHSHTMEILWSAHRSIPKMIERRLDGIKVATHPACHYCKVFPDEVTGNAENFMIPEELLDGTGVISTGQYNEKTTHCGAGFRQRFVNPGIAVAVTREKLRRLAQEKVDVCLHMCPNCAIQFDRHHDIIEAASGEEYPFVHLHVQQLLALALGADPDKDCGLGSHSQDVEPILKRIGARHTARARAAREHAGTAAARTDGAA